MDMGINRGIFSPVHGVHVELPYLHEKKVREEFVGGSLEGIVG
jgi:hypothetical protein